MPDWDARKDGVLEYTWVRYARGTFKRGSWRPGLTATYGT